ncbi:SGNH/GDSL hydrolase family protein [Streptomyces sp. WMMC500]|uniref:SGNH/GDSL hydrolase family protein n=1 Tax=Streptomyces sp. WMMC500 TaxID=3015154 RepID=UPI00248BD81D|nr:SGNH/GDSL hydrolase family protein [Streptomyces sp. WMMC500]WBB58935.1 SGNH/GDSL hydrolase family protein [Streptomyces sp. WMMC500]
MPQPAYRRRRDLRSAVSPYLAAALVMALVAAVAVAAHALRGLAPAEGARAEAAAGASGGPAQWVAAWTSMPQLTEPANLPPPPFTRDDGVLHDATLRQTVRLTVPGDQVRFRFSNAFGGADLPITRAAVALPAGGRAGVDGIVPGSSRPLTFSGRPATTVPVGAQVVSDPVRLDVAPGANLTVTLYLADGQASTDVTSHPGSRTTSYLLAGDHTDAAALPGATTTDHWYFLSGIEAKAPARTRTAVVLGDSLSDGRGSTTNGNDRWPDLLFDRLRGDGAPPVAVVNQAAGGNRVLDDGLGPNALAHLDRDVLAVSGARWLLVFEGVNDIGTAPATPAAQRETGDELLAAYDQIVTRAHAQGIRVYGATLTPFGGSTPYDDPAGLREATRQRVNDWIRTSGRFDAVVDFDAATRDPAHPRALLPAVDTGDHLHLNPEGYALLARTVPLRLFR